MPELPEVETIARELQQVLPGQMVTRVRVFRDNALDGLSRREFESRMTGQRFERVSRRGKFLLFGLPGLGHMVGHLRMTGKFVVAPPPKPRPIHHRVWFELANGQVLAFQDMRCFGTLALVEKLEHYPPLQRLGVEPLEPVFTANWLTDALGQSRTPLKHWLMDQGRIAGLGNIYVAEILHRAGLSPLRPADQVLPDEARRLHAATRKVLREALKHNGTTISDFRRVDDKTGGFQNFLRVYAKAGTPCPQCKTAIERIRQQQRSTYYCPVCQT